jgi:hypothetical protein
MVVHLFFALTVPIIWRLLFSTHCWSINTKSMVVTLFTRNLFRVRLPYLLLIRSQPFNVPFEARRRPKYYKTNNHVNVFQCVPIHGRGFEAGGYKCECLQGYEYPFEDPITYYDGQIMEAEFQNVIMDKPTRIDMFKCRLAGAAAIQSSFVIIFGLLLVLLKFR